MRLLKAKKQKKRARPIEVFKPKTMVVCLGVIKSMVGIEAVPLEDYQSMERTVVKLTQAIAEAEPVRHGRWKGAGMGDYMCSRCAEVVSGNRYHYCPNCGARMDKE